MKIELWAIAKSKPSWVADACVVLAKRCTHFGSFDYVEYPAPKIKSSATVAQVQEADASLVLGKLLRGDRLYLFDEVGKSYTSRKFAAWLEQIQLQGGSRIVFLIGGAYGHHLSVRARAVGTVQLSSMTFSHQLARVVALEQFYRAYAILNNHPYHND